MRKRILAYAVIILSVVYFYNSEAKPTPSLECNVDGSYHLSYEGFNKVPNNKIPFDSFFLNGETGKMTAKVVRSVNIEKASGLSLLVQKRLNDGDPMKFVYYRELPYWFAEGDKPWKISIDTPKEQLPIDGIEHIEVLTVRYEGYGNPYSFTYHDTNSFTHYGKCLELK